MLATVRNVSLEFTFTTIIISPDKKNPDAMIYFYCPYCATGIAQVKGHIVNLLPGFETKNTTGIFSKCHRCKEIYSYNILTYYDKEERTRLTLIAKPDYFIFHCFICRTPLLEYNQYIVKQLQPEKSLTLPADFSCSKPDCKKEYRLSEIVV
jgi:uncharacterized protein with PIN domain